MNDGREEPVVDELLTGGEEKGTSCEKGGREMSVIRKGGDHW